MSHGQFIFLFISFALLVFIQIHRWNEKKTQHKIEFDFLSEMWWNTFPKKFARAYRILTHLFSTHTHAHTRTHVDGEKSKILLVEEYRFSDFCSFMLIACARIKISFVFPCFILFLTFSCDVLRYHEIYIFFCSCFVPSILPVAKWFVCVFWFSFRVSKYNDTFQSW